MSSRALFTLFCLAANLSAQSSATLTIRTTEPGPKVQRQIFGQFAEHLGFGIYGGIWVGEDSKIPNTRGYRNDVLNALKRIHVPVVRWPGGCFADEYNWREGVGPRSKRPVKINTHWGGVTEPNSFGTHEFMDFAELLGAEAYVSGNVGNGSPREMAEWVEYLTSPAGSLADERKANGRPNPWQLPFFGLGNELWGCGGNMRAEYAADVTRRYSTFIKPPKGVKVMKMASGPTDSDYHWTEVMMRDASRHFDGIGLHYYTLPGNWKVKGPAYGFDETAWAKTLAATLRLDDYLTRHSAIMDKYDPPKRLWLGVDEWGSWYDPEPGSNPGFLQQQNTLRDALIAALNINLFVKHAARVKMANIAQMINVLQAMIFTRDDRMVLTPTYHVFDMFQGFMDSTSLPHTLQSPWYSKDQFVLPALSASTVQDASGKILTGLANTDPNRPLPLTISLNGRTPKSLSGSILSASAMDARNTFEQPSALAPAPFTGGKIEAGSIRLTLPPKSVVVLTIE
ncbi:MAG: alpha-N-arabinofuranosidase [Bryobacter sp.]|jgi:alpha-N-arabinofuranosidase|nr:alpha-N-arabinofuranosidase [Bryobacter sp. CoA8 C33]